MPSMENRMEFGHCKCHVLPYNESLERMVRASLLRHRDRKTIRKNAYMESEWWCVQYAFLIFGSILFLFLLIFLSNKSSELFICDHFLLMTTGLTICRSSLTIYSEVWFWIASSALWQCKIFYWNVLYYFILN